MLLGLIVVAVVAPFLLPVSDREQAARDLPWQIEVLPDGRSNALGLTLPTSTLAQARARFGPDVELGVIADQAGALSFEAYFPSARLGFVTGKLILSIAAPAGELEVLASRSIQRKTLPSGAHKLGLSAGDAATTGGWKIRAMTFIPSAQLTENLVLERFGNPQERVRISPTAEHFLYSRQGLDVLVDREGKEVLQYVAPREFGSLRSLLARPPAAQ